MCTIMALYMYYNAIFDDMYRFKKTTELSRFDNIIARNT